MTADLSDRQLVRKLSDALQAVARVEGASRPNEVKLTAARHTAAQFQRELGLRLIDGRWQAWDALSIESAPAGRRANNAGSIYEDRKRGRFVAEVTIDGQRYRKSCVSRSDAEQWLREAAKRASEGRDVREVRWTVGEWLDHLVSEVWPREGLSARTLATHRDGIDRWWKPEVGDRRLPTLRPEDVDRVVGKMVARGLSPNSVRIATAPLLKALNQALRRGYVTRNVASLATKPKIRPVRETKYLDPAEARTLLAAAADARFGDAIALSMLLGLRRGEVLGLAWDRVALDGDRATVTIDRQLIAAADGPTAGTKTGLKGQRTIVLPAAAADVLRRRLDRQRFEQRAAGDAWSNEHGLVFTTVIGTPIEPRNYGRAVEVLTERVLGRKVNPHALRHTAATLLHEAGVSMKVAASILGHTSEAMSSHYTHVLTEQHDRAAQSLDALLASGS